MSDGNGETLVLEAGDARVTVDLERGGRLSSLRIDELELLVERTDDPLLWGCYPMAPWTGRLRRGRFSFRSSEYALPITMDPHAIHGTTWNRRWEHDGNGRLTTPLGREWPFEGEAVQEISLEPHRLRLALEIHATAQPFPASLGWHPWFRRQLARGSAARLEFDATYAYEMDDEGIPTGVLLPAPEGPWDDCFLGVRRPPRLVWPGALELELRSPAVHWVVYDRPEHALCVEPMTGPPDALNLAPELVEPNRPLRCWFDLVWSR